MGIFVGEFVGPNVGMLVGVVDGFVVGAGLGTVVGRWDGGVFVGSRVGIGEGNCVGLAVGEIVGPAVGAASRQNWCQTASHHKENSPQERYGQAIFLVNSFGQLPPGAARWITLREQICCAPACNPHAKHKNVRSEHTFCEHFGQLEHCH